MDAPLIPDPSDDVPVPPASPSVDPDATILVERTPVPAVDPAETILVEPRSLSRTDSGAASAEIRGAYALLKEIARGGMGQIYEGNDPQLARQVAVKVSSLAQGGEDPRFAQEAKVLAKLAHPNIVPVYNLGTDSQGRPFYSMKLVKGRSLQAILKQLQQGDAETKAHFTRARLLSIFQKVCDAMAFAHSHRILHRDLKPDNVMVGEFGEVLVMDWGLAKVIGTAETVTGTGVASGSDFGMTLEGEVMGTPQYMSPEQAAGVVAELDERSDIYSLGGILYAILTLRPPIDGKSLDEVLSKVKSGHITPIETTGDAPPPASGMAARKVVPLELVAVVRKAMALDKGKRYQSIREFSADIEAYLNGFATQAEGAGLWRQLVLLVKRHKAIAAMVALLLMVLPAFTLKLAASERRAVAERRGAVEQRGLAEEQRRVTEEQKVAAKESEQKAVANAQKALEEKKVARRAAASAQLALADVSRRETDAEALQRNLEQVPEDLREDTWSYLHHKLDTAVLTSEAKGGSPFCAIAAHPKKAGVFFTVQQDGWIRSVDVGTGEITDLFQIEAGKMSGRFYVTLWSLAVSPDGERLAVAGVSNYRGAEEEDKAPAVYLVRDGKKLFEAPVQGGVFDLTFSRDGALLLGAGESGLNVWNVPKGELLWSGASWLSNPEWQGLGSRVLGVKDAFSADGKRIQVVFIGGVLELDSKSGVVTRPLVKMRGGVYYAPSPSWSELYMVDNGWVRRFGRSDGSLHSENRSVVGTMMGAVFIPKTALLVTVARRLPGVGFLLQAWKDGVLLWSEVWKGSAFGGDTRSEKATIVAHPISGEVVIFQNVLLKAWRVKVSPPTSEVWGYGGNFRLIKGSPFLGDSQHLLRLVKVDGSWGLQVLDRREKDLNQITAGRVYPMKFGANVGAGGISRSGQFIAVAGGHNRETVEVFRREAEILSSVGKWKVNQVGELRFSPSGDRFCTMRGVYDTLTGKRLRDFAAERLDVRLVAYDSWRWVDSNRIVKLAQVKTRDSDVREEAGFRRELILWDVDSLQRVSSVEAPLANSVDVSPDGEWIAEGGDDMRIRIRNARTLKVEREYRAHDGSVTGVAWHPKLPLLVSVSEDLSIKIWDSRTGQLVEELRGFTAPPTDLFVSPDGVALSVLLGSVRANIYEPESFRGEGK